MSDPGRLGAVYVGANDGMLHAFRADTGVELWAYIPSAVVPNLYKLADAAYANNHQFYVDGPITVGDAYDGSAWKTVLVGGLGRGGKAYFALDVTDPEDPKALWEFDTDASDSMGDDDLGYSYGNAILTKRSSDGKWVVIFASGYNNNASGGDSKGRLYVVDAFTGEKLNEFETDSAADPDVSGIAKINNWVLDTLLDNVTRYVYGGDLGGSLWRFDLEETDEDEAAQLLGKTSATAGNQPITVKPELARIKDSAGNYQRTIYFGTGRYLGFDDLKPAAPSSAIAQAIYAVKDTGSDLGVFSDPSGGNLVEQTLVVDATTPRKIDNPLPVDWATRNGWYIDAAGRRAGERRSATAARHAGPGDERSQGRLLQVRRQQLALQAGLCDRHGCQHRDGRGGRQLHRRFTRHGPHVDPPAEQEADRPGHARGHDRAGDGSPGRPGRGHRAAQGRLARDLLTISDLIVSGQQAARGRTLSADGPFATPGR